MIIDTEGDITWKMAENENYILGRKFLSKTGGWFILTGCVYKRCFLICEDE